MLITSKLPDVHALRISAASESEKDRAAFFAAWRPTCRCEPIELRQEGPRLECARCGRPIVRARAA